MTDGPSNGASRPNIVFIFADDWGWGDLGCYGHQQLETPNLDRLAAEGVLFTQFYVCSGVCSPSRAAAMTGQFPARWSVHGHFSDPEKNARRGMPNWLDPAAPTYTRALQGVGYRVGHFGKWHLGSGEGAPSPIEYGIDECRVNAGNGPQLGFPVVDDRRLPFLRGSEEERLGAGPRTRSSEMIVDESIAFIERHRDEPFMANVWLNDTHATLDPDADMLERYEHLMPTGVMHKHVGANAIYYASVTEADRQVGRLMDRLDALSLRDDTIVIFSSDNGPEDIVVQSVAHSGVGSPGPFRGRKRSLYEGGMRVPFIVRWPNGGAAPGTVDHDTPLCAVDLLPTFCRIAGAELPGEMLDGESMEAAFRGRTCARRKPLMWEWRFRIMGHCINRSPSLAIRQDRWKLLINPSRDRVELYDIPRDPMELNNRTEAQPEVVQELSERVLAWQTELPEGPYDAFAGSNNYPWPGET